MKKIILLINVILLFSSCEKVDDDTNLNCIENCTHIEGKITTKDNLPVKNIQLIFRFQKSIGTNSIYTRKIAKTKTDSNGNYSMDFYLKDEELGDSGPGWLNMFIVQNSINGNLFYVSNICLFEDILPILDRNTSLVKNVYLPTKKEIKIKLKNFVKLQEGDYFEVQLYVPSGFEDNEFNGYGNYFRYHTEAINKYRINIASQTFTIPAALNQTNYVVLVRMKNGVYTEETIPVSVDENSNTVLTYDY